LTTPNRQPPIGIFDSGIGGLSVAAAMAELLPEESFLYVADNAYAPYALIEAEPSGSLRLKAKLRQILEPMLEGGVDTLVLGCTHYPMVKDDIAEVCGVGVNIIDPSPAAARQVRRLLGQRGLLAETLPGPDSVADGPAHTFISSGSSAPLQRVLLTLKGLNGKRKLVVPQARWLA